MDFAVVAVAVVVVTGVMVVVAVVLGLGAAVFVAVLIQSLFKAQMGHLHLSKTLLMCYSYFCSSCALVQTVLELCVRVLTTLYLAERL